MRGTIIMDFQNDHLLIQLKLHLSAPPHQVYEMLATDAGRARFWAESAVETRGYIDFSFPNRQTWQAKILDDQPPHRFALAYFGGSTTTFDLTPDDAGGTDLTLTDKGVASEDRTEVIAGWVSVLLALKAAVDFSIDLRNHDPQRTWDDGFVDN